MTDRQFPLTGSTLIVGPSGAGKTTMTAAALTNWLSDHDPCETVIFEFGPELARQNRIIGSRLDRFASIPDDVWIGSVDANAPRSQGDTPTDVLALAKENATQANRLFAAAPSDPKAVFVNDVTIAFQHEAGELDYFLEYCSGTDCVVINAYEGDEFGQNDDVSRQERSVLQTLRTWADRVVELD